MYFEAETNGVQYEVNVNEVRGFWQIGIREKGKDWVHYNLPKTSHHRVEGAISFLFNNSSYWIDVTGEDTEYTIYTRNAFRTVKIYNEESLLHESLKRGGAIGGGDQLTSGMPGKIVKIMVEPGQQIKAGQPLLIMEAMKMENEMRAAQDCKIKEVKVKAGETVEAGAVLITFAKA